jgi:hypothetical protein
MKKIFRRAAVLPLSLAIFLAAPLPARAADRLEKIDLELNLGSRVDQFDWNIAGNSAGANPNILSELTWEDLEILEINSQARIVMFNNRLPFGGMARASLNYGEIQDGAVQDSDYQYDGRTNEWSRSNSQADQGEVWDFTAGAGLVFRTRDHRFTLAPLFGYSHHVQNLTIHDGYQVISRDNPFSSDPAEDPQPVGPIVGLDSSYEARWRSGWAGLDLNFQPGPKFELHGSVELHAAEYKAEANWNLRDDLAHPRSFAQDSDEAAGVVTTFGTRFGAGIMRFNLDLRYQIWRAEDGVDKVYFADGSTSITRVNEINWESFSVSAGLTASF